MWYQKFCSAPFRFVTIHACDRQTDRQNYDSQDRPCICSHGKNHVSMELLVPFVGNMNDDIGDLDTSVVMSHLCMYLLQL